MVAPITRVAKQQLIIVTSHLTNHARFAIAAMPVVRLCLAYQYRVVKVDARRVVFGFAGGADEHGVGEDFAGIVGFALLGYYAVAVGTSVRINRFCWSRWLFLQDSKLS